MDLAVALPWDEAQALARDLAAAREAERTHRMADSVAALERVRAKDGKGSFGAAAEDGLRSIALTARDELLRARDVAQSDAHESARALERAALEFHGTPYEGDFVAVREQLMAGRAFPQLEEARN